MFIFANMHAQISVISELCVVNQANYPSWVIVEVFHGSPSGLNCVNLSSTGLLPDAGGRTHDDRTLSIGSVANYALYLLAPSPPGGRWIEMVRPALDHVGLVVAVAVVMGPRARNNQRVKRPIL